MKFSNTFWKIADTTANKVVIQGGSSSSKTYSMLQYFGVQCLNATEPILISVVAESVPVLKRGAQRDLENILHGSQIPYDLNRTDRLYKIGNGVIELLALDDPRKAHGPRRDHLFINEAQNIPWHIANQLMMRTSGRSFFDFNPTHEFWAHTEILPREDSQFIKVTYKDNATSTGESLLDASIVDYLEGLPKDSNDYRVYVLG